tara:strand:- start:3067 stop:3645 length:579 start_codon:yes stop_codon:yes gene_type:complete
MIHVIAKPQNSSRVEAFVALHQAGLWRWLRALGCEAARAEEHCQDALLAGLHHQVQDLDAEDASRWLRRAAKNLFLMELRREKRRPKFVAFDELDAAWQSLGGDADGGSTALTALNRCLLALAPRDRELISRRYEQRDSRASIATALGVSDAGVKQALRRVRDKLRLCVQRRVNLDDRESNEPTGSNPRTSP